METADLLKISPVIPVLIIEHLETAVPLGRALVDGGLMVLEVTLRTPAALPALEMLRKALPDALVGAGTLTRTGDVQAAVAAGAQFGVSPGLTPEIVEAARGQSLPLLPGVMTPTEVIMARNAGFRALKLFPAQQAGGISMLKALGSPFPDVTFCPTGGITRITAPEYLALPNVACVGGSWIAPRNLLEARDWKGVEALARDAAGLRSRA
jgi:2-dehydro-3-deoxyphosphogluconate aldolase / (4S)-4-hydroxy-2-oxoglutarate aldolase